MKRHWIILLLAFVVGAACSGRRGHGLLLDKADSLVAVKPDSALRLLEHLPVRSLHTEEERARYALLLTEARDRCYVVQTDDSLIRTAVDYYDAQGDAGMRARAYYRWGSVLRDKKEQARAVEKYLEAVDLAGEAEDKGLQGKIYANLGYLYYLHSLDADADSLYRLAEVRGKEVHDTLLIADALSMRGRICLANKEYDLAKQLLWRADNMLSKLKHNGIRANIYSYLSQICAKEKNFKQAISFAKQEISLQEDTVYRYRGFLFLGDAYFRAGNYDSASICFKRCLSSNSYSIKANACMRLSTIARNQGSLELALRLLKDRETYLDSLELKEESEKIQDVEVKHQFERQWNSYARVLYHYRYFLCAFLTVCAVSLFVYWKYFSQKVRSLNQSFTSHVAEFEKQRESLELMLKEKDSQIEILQKEKELNIYGLIEKKRLQKELQSLYRQRQDIMNLLKTHSDVYAKLEMILQMYRKGGVPKEGLVENDWLQLSAILDEKGTLQQLAASYDLSYDEMHYCLLLLTDYSIGERGKIMRLSRQTPYRWEKEICRKMGIEYKAGVLKQEICNRVG